MRPTFSTVPALQCLRPVVVTLASGVITAASLIACSSDDAQPARAQSDVAEGASLALAKGCTSCHGEEGQGDIGPPWQGLTGSTVELEDGSNLTADTAYIRRSILDPAVLTSDSGRITLRAAES
jgi:mono/diheme cytochrome c family protein